MFAPRFAACHLRPLAAVRPLAVTVTLSPLPAAPALSLPALGSRLGILLGCGAAGVTPAAGAEPLRSVDVDGDREGETVVEDPSLPRGTVITRDEDNDRDDDVVVVGTGGQVTGGRVVDGRVVPVPPRLPRVAGAADLDGDGEKEVIVEDPNFGGYTPTRLRDGDGDVDGAHVGTTLEGRVARIADLDGDGDEEVVVEGAGELRQDVDGDGDADLVLVPTGAPETQEPPGHQGGCTRVSPAEPGGAPFAAGAATLGLGVLRLGVGGRLL